MTGFEQIFDAGTRHDQGHSGRGKNPCTLTDAEFAIVLVGVGALLTTAFITTNLSRKFGLPSLLLYLGLGLLFGNGGPDDFLFDYPDVVERVAESALGLILFKGGYKFRHELWGKPKVLSEGLTLALLGTLLTALITALFVRMALGWAWAEALLLGAILSSTDAAAVFGVFANKKLNAVNHEVEVLELESSTNDPLAYGLVAGLILVLSGQDMSVAKFVGTVMTELFLGFLVGGTVGLIMLGLTKVTGQKRGSAEILWLAVLTSALGCAELAGANPLITAFTAGVVLSSKATDEINFWGPLVALSEVVLFLLLGLQVFPNAVRDHAGEALMVTLVLVFISRPLAAIPICALFCRDVRRGVFISWAGLRGASPIVFGLLPVIANVPRCHQIFAIVFCVVVFSVLAQGTTIGWAASKLGLGDAD